MLLRENFAADVAQVESHELCRELLEPCGIECDAFASVDEVWEGLLTRAQLERRAEVEEAHANAIEEESQRQRAEELQGIVNEALDSVRAEPRRQIKFGDLLDFRWSLRDSIRQGSTSSWLSRAFVKDHGTHVGGRVEQYRGTGLDCQDNATDHLRKMVGLYSEWEGQGVVRLARLSDLPPCDRHRKPELALACVSATHRVECGAGEFVALPVGDDTIVVGLLSVGKPVSGVREFVEVVLARNVGEGFHENTRSLSTWRRMPGSREGFNGVWVLDRPAIEVRSAIVGVGGEVWGAEQVFAFRVPSVEAWERVVWIVSSRQPWSPYFYDEEDSPRELVPSSSRDGP